MPDQHEVRQALEMLRGLPLRSLGRAANMLWLGFGPDRSWRTPRGEARITPEWSLHVQCAWRICRGGRIVVARQDFYYASNGNALDGETWDLPGASGFDQAASTLNEAWAITAPTVVSCSADDVGGGSLFLTDDLRVDLFPDHARRDEDSEHWRLFRTGGSHFVVS